MNASRYDEWKNTDAVFWSTIFLDCVASEFIDWCEKRPEVYGDLKNAVEFTRKTRALGLGCLGFHTYLQKKNIAFEELQAGFVNQEIFKHIHDEALLASQWMAKELGEPEYCKGFGVRNTHRIAIAPNTTSAIVCGGDSMGIEITVANVYNQLTAAGEISRIAPVFLQLMKDRNKYHKTVIKDIISNQGSVQHLDWLTEHEKLVFKTAYEVNQEVVIRLASQRQQYICQAQSLNLFFSADEKEEVISAIHKKAFLDKNIKSLYYMRTLAGVKASTGECVSCEG
jgi:ribonucleoside-diphosphate reductase alpha chain